MPRADSNSIPRRSDSDSTPRADSDSTPRADSNSIPWRSDSDSTPRADSYSTPRADSNSIPQRSDSDSTPQTDSDSDSTLRVKVLSIWKNTPAGMIFGRDLEQSPTGSGWKRNQWILQIRCPTVKPYRTQDLARNGLMPLMRNSDLWLKTRPGTTLGWKTFQLALRPSAPSGSSEPRSCPLEEFDTRPGWSSEALSNKPE